MLTSSPRPTMIRLGLLLAALGAAMACNGSKADRAAKARIFSPEEPAPDVRQATEALDVSNASSDGRVWSRLWEMDRVEVTHRIGSHRADSKVHFKWTRQGKTVELGEEALFETDATGQFHTTLTNDQDSGLEFVWADGHAWAKGRYGAFRARRNDRAQQDHWREQATNSLKTVYELFDRQLHGTPDGTTSVGGHPARKFTLSLGEAWGPKPPASAAPAPVYGKVRVSGQEEDAPDGGSRETKFAPGPDEETARRLEFDQRKVPESVSGEIVVDETTGVIVKGSVHALFRVPEASPKDGAVLELTVSYDLRPEANLKIEPPKNVVATRLPHAVNDPLWFWSPDGGSHAAASSEEEEPDVGEDDAPAHDSTGGK